MMRVIKRQYSSENKKNLSASVWEKVEKTDKFKKAKVVMAYWSMDDEVYTHDFVRRWSATKELLLPCVRGDELEIRRFEGDENMVAGEGYGIPEPVGAVFPEPESIDLILVPGVAFDADGNRLGRGKGYYDKILKRTSAYKMGVCFDFQYVSRVPVEECDMPVDTVVVSVPR